MKNSVASLICCMFLLFVQQITYGQTLEIDAAVRGGTFRPEFLDRLLQNDAILVPNSTGGASASMILKQKFGSALAANFGIRYLQPIGAGVGFAEFSYLNYGTTFKSEEKNEGLTVSPDSTASTFSGSRPNTSMYKWGARSLNLGFSFKPIPDRLTLSPHAGWRSIHNSFEVADTYLAYSRVLGYAFSSGSYEVRYRLRAPTFGLGTTIGLFKYLRVFGDITVMRKTSSSVEMPQVYTNLANIATFSSVGLTYLHNRSDVTMTGRSYKTGFEIGPENGIRIRIGFDRDEYRVRYPQFLTLGSASTSSTTTKSTGAITTSTAVSVLPAIGAISQAAIFDRERLLRMGTYSVTVTAPIQLVAK